MTDARPHRGVLIPTVFVLAAFAALIGLGVWQLERLAWKEDLIRTLDQRIGAAPTPLPPSKDWASFAQETSEFRRVTASVEYLDRPRAYVYTPGSALRPDIKAPGYFVFVPARLASGERIVANAGYVPDRDHPWAGGQDEVTGYLRWPEGRSFFVSDHDASGSIWHVRDPRLMAARLGWGDVAPFYIDLESPVPPGGLPKPGPLTVKLRNDHLGYAITWFGLAAALVVVFLLWSVRRAYGHT